MEAVKLNPVFDDLNHPDTILNHVGQLQQDLETEKKQETNPFPVDAFPKSIRQILQATNESLNFPIDFIGASILYAISVAIGNTHRARIMKEYEQNAVLYLAIIGRPGTNKSEPLKWALKPIGERDNQKFQKYQIEKQEYDRLMNQPKKERNEQTDNDPVKPIWEQYLVSDFTPEALASVHSFNKRGLGVNVDELASWFKNFNRYQKGSEQEFWLSVWSGNTITINRKTSEPINVPLPFISVAGTIQPGVLNELATGRTENGFLDRLLFVDPPNLKKKSWSEKELDLVIVENWYNIISGLLDLPLDYDEGHNPRPQILTFTPEAKRCLFKWQKELTDLSNKPENEATAGIYAKMEMYAIRLALCLEMARYACGEGNKEAISIEAVEGALKLVEYFNKTALKVHSIISNANPLDNLTNDKRNLYMALPDTFTTETGIEVARSSGMAVRTFKRFLNKTELFNKIRRGEYEKCI